MLKFSHNWNNKLSCKYFSTIRLFSQKFQVGSFYAMDYKGSRREVECVYKQPIKLKDIPDCIFFLDTGYDKDTSINIFRTMYKNSKINVDTATFCIYVFRQDLKG